MRVTFDRGVSHVSQPHGKRYHTIYHKTIALPFNWLLDLMPVFAAIFARFVIFFVVVLQKNCRSVLAGLCEAK